MSSQPWNIMSVRSVDFTRPYTAPPTVRDDDGTLLFRYRLTGVVYARSREEAQATVETLEVFLEACRLELPPPTTYPSDETYVSELRRRVKLEDVDLPGGDAPTAVGPASLPPVPPGE